MSLPISLPFYKTPYTAVTSSISQVGPATTPIPTIACVGHRTAIGGSLAPLVPAPGYPTLSYFFPFALPSFGSGDDALAYMKNLGFTVNYGLSGTLTFPAPSNVTTNPNGTVSLGYSSVPANFNLLYDKGFTAAITQSTSSASGTFVSATNNTTYPAILIVSGVDPDHPFLTTSGDLITLSYINNTLGRPDPNRTEEICMMVYYIYTMINGLQSNAFYNYIKPNVFISVLTDKETSGSFSPNATPLALGNPTNVVAQTDGSVYLGWTSVPTNWVYMPNVQLGLTKITQANTSTTTATLLGVLPPQTIAGCPYVIHVASPTNGPYTTTVSASLALDPTQNVFVLMDNLFFTTIINPYDVATDNDITTNQATFFNYISSVNQPAQAEKGHCGVFGTFANTTINALQMNTLPTAVNSVLPAQWHAPVYYPYVPNVGEYPQSSAMIAAAYATYFSCNTQPFNPQSRNVMPGILSSANQQNRVTYGTTGATCSEIALDLGWTPLVVDPSSAVLCSRPITGQTTLPNTSLVDQEFFPISTWQIVQSFQLSIKLFLDGMGIKKLRQTPRVFGTIESGVAGLMKQYEDAGMFENVKYWATKIVVQKSNNPDTILIGVPIQVIPELASAFVSVGLITSLYQVPTS